MSSNQLHGDQMRQFRFVVEIHSHTDIGRPKWFLGIIVFVFCFCFCLVVWLFVVVVF